MYTSLLSRSSVGLGAQARNVPPSVLHNHTHQRAPAQAKPAPSLVPDGGSCGVDSCSLSPARHLAPSASSNPSTSSRGVATQGLFSRQQEAVTTTPDPDARKWWKKDKELWIDAHTEEDFYRETSTGDKLVVVDFFATWCHGCEKSYPEICKAIKDPDYQKRFKFVKVCVDELKALAKSEGVTALPRVHVYKPGQGMVVAIDVPASKVRNFKHNLNVLFMNPGMAYAQDPNGFVTVTGKAKPPAEAAAAAAKAAADKKAEVEKLQQGHTGLFEHLLKVANVKEAGGPKEVAPPPAHSTAGSDPVAGSAGANAMTAPAGVQDAAAYQLARAKFLERSGSEYGYGGLIDMLYPQEVGCRMKPNEHYMDYTGSSVYCQSQLDAVFNELRTSMFGNPHSANPSSAFTSEKVEEVRDLVLKFFKADPAEYQVVFTKSATDALKTVGETFPWGQGSLFRYLRENHNSVLGVREYALQAGGSFQAVNESFVERWLTRGDAACDHVPPRCAVPAAGFSPPDFSPSGSSATEPAYSLFAFPAEDNFAGVKYPLSWVGAVQERSTPEHRWLVMLDAAAYVPTQPLDLSQVQPDFVDMSFYKMFGYPTGLGALIIKTSLVPMLRKVFWGGGTVALATSEDNFHVLKCKPSDKLEDGTVAFLDIISLKHGFGMIDKLGGIHKVQGHVAALTEWLYDRLSKLRHSNGARMMAIFGKHQLANRRSVQGGILNFEVLRPDGSIHSYKQFEREAAAAGFHVRTGAECNPGACYNYLGVKESEIESLAGQKEGCEDDVEFITVPRAAPVSSSSPSTPKGSFGSGNGNGMTPSVGNALAPSCDALHSSDLLRSIANSNISLGHPGELATQWVQMQMPLGSVRASLGYMSTFEDCYAFAEWIERTYTDRE